MLTESTILAMDLSLVARQPKPAREMVIPIFPRKKGANIALILGRSRMAQAVVGAQLSSKAPKNPPLFENTQPLVANTSQAKSFGRYTVGR